MKEPLQVRPQTYTFTAHHATETQVCITINETPHIEGPHLTEDFPEISVDPDHIHHTRTAA